MKIFLFVCLQVKLQDYLKSVKRANKALLFTIAFISYTGLRGSITLLNERNFPAEFSWSPIVDEKGTAFSIRPSGGKFVRVFNTM